jgi:hypothetical protein
MLLTKINLHKLPIRSPRVKLGFAFVVLFQILLQHCRRSRVGAIETVPFFGGYFRHSRHAALKVEFEAAVGAVTKYGIVAQFLTSAVTSGTAVAEVGRGYLETVEGNRESLGTGMTILTLTLTGRVCRLCENWRSGLLPLPLSLLLLPLLSLLLPDADMMPMRRVGFSK